eukprot:4682-Heterococcus_DN1.PRE.8
MRPICTVFPPSMRVAHCYLLRCAYSLFSRTDVTAIQHLNQLKAEAQSVRTTVAACDSCASSTSRTGRH